jgi:hypothetical protein
MAGMTNRGKYRALENYIRGGTPPITFYVALVTDAVAPTADTNTLGQLTEIAAGNGYTSGGQAVARTAVAWDVLTEDDALDLALIQAADLTWMAIGGPLPSAGAGARYAVLTDDNIVVANREVLAFWDLGNAISLASGQLLTLQDCELRATE